MYVIKVVVENIPEKVVTGEELVEKLLGMIELAQERHEDNFPCKLVRIDLEMGY
jgi:hypothetical protein